MGGFLRERYNDLLPNEYHRKDLYVRSTDRDRTLLSAVSNLGSFYNISQTGYMPIPIHTLPTESDNLLRYPNMNCKKYADISKELHGSPLMVKLNEEYKDDLAKMAKLVNSTETFTIQNAWPILDTIECHIANNKSGE